MPVGVTFGRNENGFAQANSLGGGAHRQRGMLTPFRQKHRPLRFELSEKKKKKKKQRKEASCSQQTAIERARACTTTKGSERVEGGERDLLGVRLYLIGGRGRQASQTCWE